MKKRVHIIGLRAYPAEFEGTSGIEFYTQHLLEKIHELDQNIFFCIFTRNKYQKIIKNKKNYYELLPFKTISHKTLETLFYSFLATMSSSSTKGDIVWFHGIGSAFFSWIPLVFGKKVIITIHSFDWERKKWTNIEKTAFLFIVKIIFKLPIQFLTVSNDLALHLFQKYNIRARVISPGLRVSPKAGSLKKNKLPKELRKSPYLLYLGRIVPEKRIEWLLGSDKAIPSNYKIAIFGHHGNSADYFKHLKKKNSNSSKILWGKSVFGQKKEALIKYAHGVIIPSDLEGLPITMLETISSHTMCLIASEYVPAELKKVRQIITFDKNSMESFNKSLNLLIKKTNATRKNDQDLSFLSKFFSWELSAKKMLEELS